MAMINRNVKLILATLAVVAGVFFIEYYEKITEDNLTIFETNVKFQDYRQYKLAGGNVGLPIFYLDGFLGNISKENKVELGWKYEGRSGKLKCRLQGQTTLGFPKKSYMLSKFDSPLDVGWGLRKRYTLKADYNDCSHARNIVGAKLWGQIVKNRTIKNDRLMNLPNGGTIDGFPVYLVLNGKYVGIYSLCISKDEQLFGMTKAIGECLLTATDFSNLTHFNEQTTTAELKAGNKFKIKYAANEGEWITDSVNRLIHACKTDNNIEFEQCMDVDSAIDLYIYACLLSYYDCGKNLMLNTFDGVKWNLTPYDLDGLFGNHFAGHSYFSPDSMGPTIASYHKWNGVMHMVYKFHKDKLKTRYAQLRNSVLSEVNVMNMIYNYMVQIPEVMKQEEYKLYPKMPGTNTNTAAQMIEWYRLRCIAMDKEMMDL